MFAYDYERAFSRNLGLVNEAEQARLAGKRVALPGCGGVGGVHALVLARLGVGNFVIADFDRFEIANFNRQFGAKMSTIGREKTSVVAEEIAEINPCATTRVFPTGISAGNIEAFLDDVDLVVDGLDFFAFDARELLFRRAWERGIPLLTAAPLGFSCALLLFARGGMSPADYFGFSPSDDRTTRALKFITGLSPRALHAPYMDRAKINFENGRGPSSAVGVSLCAAMAGAQAVRILLGRADLRPAPHFSQFDAYRGIFRAGKLRGGHRNPFQRVKRWYLRRHLARGGEKS